MPKTKKWIDKKNAVTFHLVHRSQRDPLAADEDAPQRVLLDANPTQDKKANKLEERRKYGIYFDDDYDYLQHLREKSNYTHWELQKTHEESDSNQVKEIAESKKDGIKLPSSVFASSVEEDVGLPNRAAQQSGLCLDWDPDIVAAMDEDFDFDDPNNQLEDDFFTQANACESGSDIDEEDEYISDDVGSGCDMEETKSRFTEFSMTSSVVPRNDQLNLLDDRFEKMFAEYDEEEIGPLDSEEIEGFISEDATVLGLAKSMRDTWKVPDPEKNIYHEEEEDSSSEDERLVDILEKERWDCESILSTFSNSYNHPKLITEPKVQKIRVNQRTGMPMTDGKLTARNLATLEDERLGTRGPGSIVSAISTLSLRDKTETLEQKKARKAALRVYRRDRRIEKAINKKAFKTEKQRQEKNFLNTRVSNVAVHNL